MDYCAANGASRVEFLPTVINLDRYRSAPSPNGSELRIAWVGSPSTEALLQSIAGALRAVAKRFPIRLVSVGARHPESIGIPVEAHPWSEDTEAAIIESCHSVHPEVVGGLAGLSLRYGPQSAHRN